MARMRGAAAVAAAAVALAATGCGNIVLTIGGNGAGQPAALQGPPRQALLDAMATTKSQSYDFTMDVSMTGLAGGLGSQLGSAFGASATGAFSASQDAMRMNESVSSSSGLLGSLAGGTSSPVHSLAMLLFVKTGDVYISTQGLPGANVAPGVKWIQESAGNMASLAGGSPAAYLNAIAPYVVSVKTVGPAVVDGVQTTELEVTENLRAMAGKLLGSGLGGELQKAFGSSLPSSMSSEIDSWMQSAMKSLPATMVDRVWVDGQGRLSQLQLSLPLGPVFKSLFSQMFAMIGSLGGSSGATGSSGQGAMQQISQMFANVTESVSMTFTNYGTTVNIARPPASEVQSLGSITGQG